MRRCWPQLRAPYVNLELQMPDVTRYWPKGLVVTLAGLGRVAEQPGIMSVAHAKGEGECD